MGVRLIAPGPIGGVQGQSGNRYVVDENGEIDVTDGMDVGPLLNAGWIHSPRNLPQP